MICQPIEDALSLEMADWEAYQVGAEKSSLQLVQRGGVRQVMGGRRGGEYDR